jgi:hypothetical protein
MQEFLSKPKWINGLGHMQQQAWEIVDSKAERAVAFAGQCDSCRFWDASCYGRTME